MIEIKVMCDYCADGLWRNGYAIDAGMLAEEFNIPDEVIKPLAKEIEEWQELYEGFEFYDPNVDTQVIMQRPEYFKFREMGPHIAEKIRKLLPDDVRVIYFYEDSGREYIYYPGGKVRIFNRDPDQDRIDFDD